MVRKTISVSELAELASQQEVDLIDVRTPAEFHSVHAHGGRNIPLDILNPRRIMEARNGTGDQPLYVICKTGSRGAKACDKFASSGFNNVINVEGGTDAWETAGHTVVRGKAMISLERQVRIVAGLVVLLASLLALFVHPYFAGVAAFVGAGLAFAGITDTCGMGIMLAKMPWNQWPKNCVTDRSNVPKRSHAKL